MAHLVRWYNPHVGKRLAFFSQSLGGGGAERVIVTLANEFVKRDYEVDIVISYNSEAYHKLLDPRVNLTILNIRRRLLAAPRLARYLRSRQPVAMLATVNTIAAVVAKMLAHTPTRIILREATTPTQELLYKTTSPRAKWVRIAGLKWLYPRTDGIVAVSKGVLADLLRWSPKVAGKIHLIYNPVIDERLLSLAKEPMEHPWFTSAEIPVILSAGRLIPLKGFDTLLKAFAQVIRSTQARLVILGEGEERERLTDLAATLGVKEFFDLPGFDPNPFRFMSRAQVFVLSSRYEGLPNVLIQAMACGCPVVATNCPSGPDDILDGGKYGELVPVDDVDAMAAAILRVLQGSRKPVPIEWLEQFRVDAVAEKYLKVMLGDESPKIP